MLTSPRRSRSRTSGITLSRICLTLVTLPVETPATLATSARTSLPPMFVKFDDGFAVPVIGLGRWRRALRGASKPRASTIRP